MGATEKRYEAIAIEALSLPGPERRDLVGRLLLSLNEDSFDDSENLQTAQARLNKIRSGESDTLPYEVVKERIRSKYGL